jgi:hypothetical protein
MASRWWLGNEAPFRSTTGVCADGSGERLTRDAPSVPGGVPSGPQTSLG